MLKAYLRRKNPSITHSRAKLLTKKTLNGRGGIFNVTFYSQIAEQRYYENVFFDKYSVSNNLIF
jgi:hypothetical protein